MRSTAYDSGATFFQCVRYSENGTTPDPYTGVPPLGDGRACVINNDTTGESLMAYLVETGYDRYRAIVLNVRTNLVLVDRSARGTRAMKALNGS